MALYGTRSILVAGDRVIVGSLLYASLSSFSREDVTGNLKDEQDISLPAGPEKLSRDQYGDIWAAGHANLFDYAPRGPASPPHPSLPCRPGRQDRCSRFMAIRRGIGSGGADGNGSDRRLDGKS